MFINQELLPRNFSAVYIDLGSPVVMILGNRQKWGQATIANGQIAIQYTKLTMPLMTNYIIRFQ